MVDDAKESREEKRKRQMDEVHAALGRYVEAFEQVVYWLRAHCASLITCLNHDHKRRAKQHDLMNVVFHHKCMSAETLLSMYRSLVGQTLHDAKVDEEELKIFDCVLRQFNKEFAEAMKTRNDYLHGTWFVGWGNEATQDWSEIGYLRGKATNKGMQFSDGPKTAADIEIHTEQCRYLADFLMRLHGSLTMHLVGRPLNVSHNFVSEGRGKNAVWKIMPPAG